MDMPKFPDALKKSEWNDHKNVVTKLIKGDSCKQLDAKLDTLQFSYHTAWQAVWQAKQAKTPLDHYLDNRGDEAMEQLVKQLKAFATWAVPLKNAFLHHPLVPAKSRRHIEEMIKAADTLAGQLDHKDPATFFQ